MRPLCLILAAFMGLASLVILVEAQDPFSCFDECFIDLPENNDEELELERLFELNSRVQGMRMLWGVSGGGKCLLL